MSALRSLSYAPILRRGGSEDDAELLFDEVARRSLWLQDMTCARTHYFCDSVRSSFITARAFTGEPKLLVSLDSGIRTIHMSAPAKPVALRKQLPVGNLKQT